MKFSQRSLSKLLTVDSELQDVFLEAIKFSPIDFGISEGLRTAERQLYHFKKGRKWDGTRWIVVDAKKVVTQCDGTIKKSKHQSGNAIDVFAWVNGKESYEDEHMCMIAGVVLSVANRRVLKLKWGGTFGSNDFDGWDKPHFELIQ